MSGVSSDGFDYHDEEDESDDTEEDEEAFDLGDRPSLDVTGAHNDIISIAQGKQPEKEFDGNKLRSPNKWQLDKVGDLGSTILHVISDRWTPSLKSLLGLIMRMFPDLYLKEDSLGRTILDRNDVGSSRDRFVQYFVENYKEEATKLVESHPTLLEFLLAFVSDVPVWRQILDKVGSHSLLVKDKKGDTFLHSVIRRFHGRIPRNRDWLYTVAELAIEREPKLLTARNSLKSTPYEFHLHLLHAHISKKARPETKPSPIAKAEGIRDIKETSRSVQSKSTETLPRRYPEISKPTLAGVPTDSRPLKIKDMLKPASTKSKLHKSRSPKTAELETLSIIILRQMYLGLDVQDLQNEWNRSHSGVEYDLDLLEIGRDSQSDSSHSRYIRNIVAPLRLHNFMRYVWIPNQKSDTTNLQDVFSTLKSKGVTRIMKLDVDEDIDRPSDDMVIIDALSGLQIDSIDWKKTDLCVSVIQQAVPSVQRLHLCSSGNNAVLKSWSASDGIVALEKLRHVHINMVPRIESFNTAQINAKRFGERMRRQEHEGRFLDINVNLHSLPEEQKPQTWSSVLSKTGARITATRTEESYQEWKAPINLLRWVDKLGHSLKDQLPENFAPVRIAIIDDGIDMDRVHSQSEIAGGISYAQVDAHRYKPYYISSTGQGTGVANWVSRLHRMSQLYIARLDPGNRSDFALVKAIEWSVDQNVDLIVLTSQLDQVSGRANDLRQEEIIHRTRSAMMQVISKGIAVFCPASDSVDALFGSDVVLRWGLLRIAATKWEDDIREAASEKADFTLSVKGLDEQAELSGNVLATAFAVGLAATILTAVAAQRSLDPRPRRPQLSAQHLFRIFEGLRSDKESKYVSVGWLVKAMAMDNAREVFDSIDEHIRSIHRTDQE